MKKFFLASLLAAASFNAFGAPCVNGSIQAQITAGSCEINGWSLDGWSLGQASKNGYPGLSTPTASDILVTFNTVVGVGGAQGFQVSFSNNGLANNGFFTATPGQPNDTVNWNTNFAVNTLTNGNVATVALSVDGASVTSNNGQVNIQKIVYNPLAPIPSLGSNNVLTVNGFQSTNPIGVFSNQANSLTKISVADVYQLAAGDTSSGATLTSYTNTFYGVTPQSGVPEPMSFVLMGAGLVGIAALRRRNG